jgi:hypothetical protein
VENVRERDGAARRIHARSLDARTSLIAVRGTADRTVAREIQRTILRGVASGRTRAIVDLSEVGEVRPGLLGVLLTVRRRLLAMGGALTVVSPVPVGTLFGVARADDILPRVAPPRESG